MFIIFEIIIALIFILISGESMDPDAMICMCEYKDIDGKGEKPILMFFKHGLEEEKCQKMFQHMTAKSKLAVKKTITAFTSSSSFILYHNSPCFCSKQLLYETANQPSDDVMSSNRFLFHVKMSNKNQPILTKKRPNSVPTLLLAKTIEF